MLMNLVVPEVTGMPSNNTLSFFIQVFLVSRLKEISIHHQSFVYDWLNSLVALNLS